MMNEMIEPMLPLPFRVVRRVGETADTFTLFLEPAPGMQSKGLPFSPGQFNMLYLFGVGEIPISISGDPSQPQRLVHTTRAVGTVTRVMRDLKDGEIVGVRGPFGRGWPVREAVNQDIVIIAGGIGLAPLRPAIYRILAQREQFGRVVLLYGTRTPADILYKKELEKWRGRFDLEVHVTVDRAMDHWHGNVGVVTHLISKSPFDPLNSVALICGPEVMMRFTILELQKRGVPRDKIYISMERNMKCAIGFCGHCQYGAKFICKDGPVFNYAEIQDIFTKREI